MMTQRNDGRSRGQESRKLNEKETSIANRFSQLSEEDLGNLRESKKVRANVPMNQTKETTR